MFCRRTYFEFSGMAGCHVRCDEEFIGFYVDRSQVGEMRGGVTVVRYALSRLRQPAGYAAAWSVTSLSTQHADLQLFDLWDSPCRYKSDELLFILHATHDNTRRVILRQREEIGRALDAAASFVQNVRVDHRRPNVLVAQQFLYGPDVVASFDQVGGEAVPEGVGRDPFPSFPGSAWERAGLRALPALFCSSPIGQVVAQPGVTGVGIAPV